MDTGYHDRDPTRRRENITDLEIDIDGRRPALNPRLHPGFGSVLDKIAWWFWGHEHNLSIFAPYAGLARGRGTSFGAWLQSDE